MYQVKAVATELLKQVRIEPEAADVLDLTGFGPVLPSSFCVATAAQASLAAVGAAIADFHKLRTGQGQRVAVDRTHATAEFRSERYLRVDDEPLDIWDNLSGPVQCGDGRWLRLHMLLPHHRDGVLDLLGCAGDKASITKALQAWDAAAFEDAASERGLVVAMMRSLEEWNAHPEGQAVAQMPPVTLRRIGDAPPRPWPAAERPLEAIRVLDLTRIIAGPLCGRVLACHGADVLYVTSPDLPFSHPFVIDFGRGKRSTHIRLNTEPGREDLRGLIANADVFLQAYRPGALAAQGFGPEALARQRPGIVSVSLSAYSDTGPWRDRRGFDSLVQTASGINKAEADAVGQEPPLALPCQVLDHASGYFMALGVVAALKRRAIEGGSWQVDVSLAATGQWLRSLGRVPDGHACPDLTPEAVEPYLYTEPSGFGELTAIRHAAVMSQTPARWDRPTVPLGTHAPRWSD